jgi:hypothetical protein
MTKLHRSPDNVWRRCVAANCIYDRVSNTQLSSAAKVLTSLGRDEKELSKLSVSNIRSLAALHNKQGLPKSFVSSIKNENSAETVSENKPIIDTRAYEEEFQAAYKERQFNRFDFKMGKVSVNSDITTIETTGVLVNEKYLDAKQVYGKIDPSKLDENSAFLLGFPENYRTLQGESISHNRNLAWREDPENPSEITAIQLYSSYAGNWVNACLHGDEEALANQKGRKVSLRDDVRDYPDWEDEKDIPADMKNPRTLKTITDSLDKTIRERSLPYQRTVYRGANRIGAAAANHKIGEKVIFEGYASTTYDINIASGFGSSAGVIYEIKTPAGLNIIRNSEYDHELEVLMPRNSQYIVVGKKQAKFDGQDVSVIQMIAVDDDNNILTHSKK